MSQEVPSLPKRPQSPFTSQLAELEAAFPDVEASTRRAILVAACGNLENAFNGMLALNDDTIRPAPPSQVQNERRAQLELDEQLARQLASGRRRPSARAAPPPRAQREGDGDDLSIDEIRDNLQKWGNEASKNIGSFFTNIKTRIQSELQQEEPDEDYYGRIDSNSGRASRADAYRQVRDDRLDDHFITMETEEAPPKPTRPSDKPVNAFGEDKPARWEPLQQTADSDAFFIGESDEEIDELDKPPVPKKDVQAVNDSKDTKEKEKDAKDLKDTKEIKDTKETEETKDTKAKDTKAKDEPESKDADASDAIDAKDDTKSELK